MTEHTDDPFFDGLVHETMFPVEWVYLDLELTEERAIAANVANEQLLRLMTSLGEKLPEQGDYIEHSAELERLDLKLNVLIDMAGHLLRNQLKLPAPETVRFGHGSMEWQTMAPPERGRQIGIKVYIDSSLPQFLQLYGETEINVEENVEADAGTRATLVRVKYLGLGEAVSDELEKYIFRQHRKKIALERQPDQD